MGALAVANFPQAAAAYVRDYMVIGAVVVSHTGAAWLQSRQGRSLWGQQGKKISGLPQPAPRQQFSFVRAGGCGEC